MDKAGEDKGEMCCFGLGRSRGGEYRDEHGGGGRSEHVERFRGLRVLLVDDDLAVLRMMELMLKRMGMEVVATSDPVEALRLVREGERPDLLVSDVVMPGIDGVSLADKISELHDRIKVILVTGQPEVECHYSQGLKRWPLLRKPFDRASFAKVLAEVLWGGAKSW